MTSTFPKRWLARTAAGQSVSQWPNSVMTNLADTAPKVNGQTFGEYAANWVASRVWSTGLWDGIFLDVWGDRVYGSDRSSWDVDGDGVDDPEAMIYGPGGPWERGITRAEEIMRADMPSAVLVANGDRSLAGQRLDGRAFESFADPNADRDPISDIQRYVQLSADRGHRAPGVMMTIDRRRVRARVRAGSPQRPVLPHRHPAAGRVLVADGVRATGSWPTTTSWTAAASVVAISAIPSSPIRRRTGWPRLTSRASAPSRPMSCGATSSTGSCSTTPAPRPQTIELGGPFRKLRGTQDPKVNDGSTVTSVTLPGRDGLILLLADQPSPAPGR